MTQRRFQQVDVFTEQPYFGNPVAVVLDGHGLTPEAMQRVANWTNLSETTFVLPPKDAKADYHVKIFTPSRELPFAGHPTLGTCHAWLASGGKPKGAMIVQECAVGLIQIRRDGGRLAFAAPPPRRMEPLDAETLERIASGLRIRRDDILDHSWCDNGPPWQAVLLRSARQVLEAAPDIGILGEMDLGLVGPHPEGPLAFEVRAFFPVDGSFREDPVTGSLNAALGQWLIAKGHAPARYQAAQGTKLGRRGRIHIERDGDGQVWVGGQSVTCMTGEVAL
ncbi:MAG TPA: PhzF family phenazine biosynthesis protein [Stellaceae bacterium]|nr:PhzF family phenazine biosynthesis protein [Stellaceae bacterium]